jgi:hypothetical protein
MDCTGLGKLCKNDWVKGLVVAIITAPLTIIYQSVEAGSLVINWKVIIAAALTGGIAYLLKNLGTGTGGKLLTNDQPKV